MNGKTFPYLDLAALPAVGGALLDPRPAFVFRGDGGALLWANAAGAEFFGETSIGALLEHRFAAGGPIARQLARLARLLPSETARLEIFRFSLGVTVETLPAACRRLNLEGGESAVLAIGAVERRMDSIYARAERLADAIAGSDCLVAVLGANGRVLGASGGFADLAPASTEIDALIEAAEAGGKRLAKRTIAIAGADRPAGVARIEAGGEHTFLLIVGPAESARQTADVKPPPPAEAEAPPAAPPLPALQLEPAETPVASVVPAEAMEIVAGPSETVEEPTPKKQRPLRFVWQTDADQRFTLVSFELAQAVGPASAGLIGSDWRDVAARFGLDGESRVGEALTTGRDWSGITVYWPIAGAGARVAVELSGTAVHSRDGRFEGYRGFGLCRLDDRRPDERPAAAAEPKATPEPAAIAPAASPAPPPPLLFSEEDIDDAARKSIEEGAAIRARQGAAEEAPEDETAGEPAKPKEPAIARASPPARVAEKSNVVRLPGAVGAGRVVPGERLTGMEQDAFRRIAEALGVEMMDDRQETEQREAAPGAAAEARKPAPADAVPAREQTAGEFDTRLLDRLPVGISIFRDRKTLFANKPLLDLLGYESLAGFAARGGAEAIFPESEVEGARGRLAGGKGHLRAHRRDGSTVAVEARLHAVTWDRATALMLTLREEREASPSPGRDGDLVAALDAAEARADELEAILDTATDGVIVIDGRGRIGNVNRSAEALFGIEAGDVLGKPFTELLAEESRKAALDYLDGLASNGVASVLNDGREVIGKVPQGGLIPLFMTMGRLGETGKFCAVLRDITHWKNVEEELVAARRAAEAANQQKSDFLAKISHEIRTPLNAIIGFSEVMMEERFGSIGNQRYRDYLRDINVSGGHLLSLINDLLDLSKIEAGKLELHFESVAVNESIQECVALMQPQANRERIIIRTSLSTGVPNVVADPRSLRQILLNLLSNAIKFTKAGGQVIVSTALEENGEVVVRIRDTGIGMSDRDLETAMKPFRQVAAAGGKNEGTGLGLPLTKALVEANRASFSIDSVPNQGTLVRVTFPTTRVLAG
jgi:PAS domain S-box-containing protein